MSDCSMNGLTISVLTLIVAPSFAIGLSVIYGSMLVFFPDLFKLILRTIIGLLVPSDKMIERINDAIANSRLAGWFKKVPSESQWKNAWPERFNKATHGFKQLSDAAGAAKDKVVSSAVEAKDATLNKVEEIRHSPTPDYLNAPYKELPQRSFLNKVTSFDNIYGYTFYAVVSSVIILGSGYVVYSMFTDFWNRQWGYISTGIGSIIPSLQTLRNITSPITTAAAAVNRYRNPLNWPS